MSEPSGVQWCPRFPTSTQIDDLVPPFRDGVRDFVSALRNGSALVHIGDTYRPVKRSYLMHWCCRIASGEVLPADVPPMAGVDIDWTHGGDNEAAHTAAIMMRHEYQIQFPAALASRHTQRRAIDMTISWVGALVIRDRAGVSHRILSGPRNGSNAELIAVAKTYGVIKLLSDPPHFSDDGH